MTPLSVDGYHCYTCKTCNTNKDMDKVEMRKHLGSVHNIPKPEGSKTLIFHSSKSEGREAFIYEWIFRNVKIHEHKRS